MPLSRSPCQTVSLWLNGLADAPLSPGYPYNHEPLEPPIPPIVTQCVAYADAARVEVPPTGPRVVPLAGDPTFESLERYRADIVRLVLGQRILKSNLETDGCTDNFKVIRHCRIMLGLARNYAESLDRRYRALGEHSRVLNRPEVRIATHEAIEDGINQLLGSNGSIRLS